MGTPFETVTLTSFGRNKGMYFEILEEGGAQRLYSDYSICV